MDTKFFVYFFLVPNTYLLQIIHNNEWIIIVSRDGWSKTLLKPHHQFSGHILYLEYLVQFLVVVMVEVPCDCLVIDPMKKIWCENKKKLKVSIGLVGVNHRQVALIYLFLCNGTFFYSLRQTLLASLVTW